MPLQVFVVEAGSKSIMLRFSFASIVCCTGGEVLGLLQELSTKSASLNKSGNLTHPDPRR